MLHYTLVFPVCRGSLSSDGEMVVFPTINAAETPLTTPYFITE